MISVIAIKDAFEKDECILKEKTVKNITTVELHNSNGYIGECNGTSPFEALNKVYAVWQVMKKENLEKSMIGFNVAINLEKTKKQEELRKANNSFVKKAYKITDKGKK